MFEKLKDAYVKARYSKHYTISAAELDWLGSCVEVLGRAVHAVCSDRIKVLEAAAAAPASKSAAADLTSDDAEQSGADAPCPLSIST